MAMVPITREHIMELLEYCIAVKNINDHIKNKQAEREELIMQARKENMLSFQEFEQAYNEAFAR